MSTPRAVTPAPEAYDPPKGPYLTVSFGYSVRTWTVTLTPASVAAMAVMMLVAVALSAYRPAPPEPPMSSVAVQSHDAITLARTGGTGLAPGGPGGEPGDIITPLNVRDAAALVMPPAGDPPSAAAAPPPAPDAIAAPPEPLVSCPSPDQPPDMVTGTLQKD